MKHQYIDGILYFYFYGDLDNLTVCNLKQICIDLIEKYQPKTVKLDLKRSPLWTAPASALSWHATSSCRSCMPSLFYAICPE